MTIKEKKGPPSAKRVGIFVDGQNLFHSAKSIYGRDAWVDYEALLEEALKGRTLIRAIVYTVIVDDVDQTGFIEVLQRMGYEVRAKHARVLPDGSRKADWDMGIATDSIAISDRLDTVVLVSGDGDFVDLVNFLRARGVRVEVLSFDETTASELEKSADAYYPLGMEVIHIKSSIRNQETG
jgi:uncharacterized LabA/DUF88 family protein